MNFTCDKMLLWDAILNSQKAVSPKSSLPVLEGLLLQAENNTIKITGYDLDLAIESTLEANVTLSGKIVLNSRIFGEIIRNLPGENVIFESDNKFLTTITSGVSSFNILGYDPDEFPIIDRVDKEIMLTISQQTLKSMIRGTIFSASQNINKPILCSILFEIENDILTLVALDGFRVALRKEIIENNTGKDKFSFIVPSKTLSEIMKIIDDEDKKINLILCKKHILFEFENCIVTSRLLEGNYFNYKSAIPATKTTLVSISAKDYADSIARASLLISEKIRSCIKAEFDISGVKITCNSSTGNFHDEISCEIQGENLTIGFYHKYMLEALRACECDNIQVIMNSPVGAMLIVPNIEIMDKEKINPKLPDGNFKYLVLPARLE